MQLAKIAKPCPDAAGVTPDFPPEMDVCDLVPGSLTDKPDMVRIGDAEHGIVGVIAREVLEYLIGRNDATRFARILDSLDDAVVAVDADGRIFYANAAYTTHLGVPVGKVIGKRIRDIESEAALIQVLETRTPRTLENVCIRTIDRYVSVKMHPIFTAAGFAGAVSIFRDVTELNSLNRELSRVTEEANAYRSRVGDGQPGGVSLIGSDPAFVNTVEQALVVAKTNATVLIRGENGTGKELFAQLVHEHGPRADHPFVAVNCAAIPENLIESELFGYEEGAFTGARRGGKAGKFQMAEGGTLFLDEIGDMPYAMQAKLLRVLQQGEVERVGGGGGVPVDVRIIAATNQPLEDMIERRQFRKDLYYRLNVVTLDIPPLRDRGHDILLLTNHFLSTLNRRYGKALALSGEAYQVLSQHAWSGNVRELKNCLEHAVILSTGDLIGVGDLPDSLFPGGGAPAAADGRGEAPPIQPLHDALRKYEKMMIQDALRKCDNNKTQAMQSLGMSRRTFYRKLHELGVECQ